jgi:uncharacterized protein HemX
MADGRQTPRIRMPRFGRPGRASGATEEQETATQDTEEATDTKPLTKPEESTKPGNGGPAADQTPDAKEPSAQPKKPGESPQTPEPTLEERMEGMQGWMAEIERKQARITYFGGLALLLALGAAGVALYFGLTTHSDSASKKDVDALSARVNSLQGAVTKNSKDTQNALNASIAQLQQSLSGLQKQQAQAQATISTLQTQVNAAAANQNAAAGTTTTPGTTTTTPGANQGK